MRKNFQTYGILERKLSHAAKEKKVPVIALDSPDEHERYVQLYKGKWPQDLDEKMRKAYYEKYEKTLRELIGDADKHLREKLQPHEYEFLHKKRHKKMAARSLPYTKESSLICVGIAHYLIEPSVITMYKEMGV